ncbi:MAG: bifunctional phosphoglucose/phosphomannose isomerase [Saprospirales bacterium]|nr:MAG: bifunctional phosphoglucose/phosphomannose isomerase [Saprospirales bacterium]
MDKLIARFSDQLREAIEIGNNAKISKPQRVIDRVLIAGLGGSGIGGDYAEEFVRNQCPVPIIASKGYDIPAWVNESTLAIVSSYSGNTEETLAAFEKIEKTGARIICITSGGKLKELAEEKSLDHILIPDDWPSPRACLGYSMVQQLFVLHYCGLTGDDFIEQIGLAADLLDREEDDIKTRARQIAGMLDGKTPVLYIADRMEAVAVRLRQQINENSKMLCWHHVIPEMNHNELVGWRDQRNDLAVVMFRNRDDHPRVQMRMKINKEIITEYTDSWIEVFSKGGSQVQRAMYLTNLGDWISWYLADMRNMDAIEVKVIDYLKGELARN